MKLLNHTTKYFSVAIFVIIGVWAVVFYVNMLDEVYDSLDDGLDNYKLLIIQQAHKDSTVLHKTQFEESNYSIHEIQKQTALTWKDTHRDTLMYMLNEEDYEPVRVLTTAFEQQGRYYQLKVISSMVEEDDLIEDLLFALIWLYVAMMVTIVLVNNFLLRRIWSPFYFLLNQLKSFQLKKDTFIHTQSTQVDEFQQMNQTIADLLRTVIDTYSNQKQFIENASHELQTPLAISINKLELLAEKNSIPSQDMETVGRVIQTLERLTRINKSLLLLSKIENKQFHHKQLLDLNAIIRNMVLEFEDFAAFKKVTVFVREEGTLQKMMHKELAEILISNLLKNAILHNHQQGMVEIRITSSSILIINTGEGNPLERDRLFQRFHKNSEETNATGLGLAIVKAIADLYQVGIQYSYDGRHNMLIRF